MTVIGEFRGFRTARGRGSAAKITEAAEKKGIRHPLIIAGKERTETIREKNQMLRECPAFSEFHANPDLADAEKARDLFVQENCDGLISVGGGSAIDTAKAVKALLLTENAEKLLANIWPEDKERDIPHIAVPTTAGSGAEATQFAVSYVQERKVSISHPCLKPDAVILDPSFLDTLPEYQKKSCALDALCQGIESYWSRNATEDSRVYAYLAIRGVLDHLKAYLAGDQTAAEEMLDASFQSGKAINISRTTAAHALSYRLTQTLGLAHGHACMLTLPGLWEMMMETERGKNITEELAGVMGLGDRRMGPAFLRGILLDLHLDLHRELTQAELEDWVRNANPERMQNHPVSMTEENIRRAYRIAFSNRTDMEKRACLDMWKYYGRNSDYE